MSARSTEEEREWSADKREFVANRRDEIAAKRDAVAKAREATADARETTLDEWERRLAARADELRMPGWPVAAQLADARAARYRARRDRDEASRERDTAEGDRDEATNRRHADHPAVRLAAVFAAIAEHLYASDSDEQVLQRIAETAVSTVTGCDMASITAQGDGGYRTVCTTDPAAMSVDQAQYEANEGPCLDAVTTAVVYAQSFPDGRWPTLAARPADFGVGSALSYRLPDPARGQAETGGGSLNFYGAGTDAFDDEAQGIGLILAAHASVAARVVHERSALEQIERHLQTALASRDVIGQAKGILMERLKIPPEEAFDALRRASQRLNEKLRDVARRITENGQFDRTDIPTTDRR